MSEYSVWDLRTQRPASGHYVYRLYDEAGAPLYVGSTNNFWIRAGRHVQEHEKWWPEVCWRRTVVEAVGNVGCLGARRCPLPEHAEMLRHEAEMIKSLQPRYNQRLTGYCSRSLHLLAEHGRVQLNGKVGCYTCQLERQHVHYLERKRQAAADSGQLTFADSSERT